MANSEHLDILKRGCQAWNVWRRSNSYLKPDLRKLELNDLNLDGIDFTSVDLRGTKFHRVSFAGATFYLAKLNGASFSDVNLKSANFIWTDVTGAKLRGVQGEGADFAISSLDDADLRSAYLEGANFYRARAYRADFSWANLRYADFSESKLTHTRLAETDLQGAKFIRVQLYGTIFTKATMGGNIFADSDLSEAIDLDTIRHLGPSDIGVRTIYLSGGKISHSFLREAGLPDNFITYMGSLTVRALEFYSCFISYSSKDNRPVARLYDDLQTNGVSCWFAPHDLKIGDKIRRRLDESIRIHDKVLLVLSKNSIRSNWVEKEVETAFEEERSTKRTILFPIRLDNSVMKIDTGWAADIRRTRHIGDFRKWKDLDEYQKSFTRLISDLRLTKD